MRQAREKLFVAAFSVVSAFTGSLAGAFQTTAPAQTLPTTSASTLPADAVAVTATITSVKGTVQVRGKDGAPWEPVKVGMKLDQGAEIRTGLRSSVQFVVGKDEFITLDRLGTVTVLQAIESRGKAKTDIGLKYGRARYDIHDTDLQHESTIRSPGSTLAIRGTDVTYEDQAPWVPRAVSREGRAEFRNYKRTFVAFGGKRRAAVAADKATPAQVALTNTKADPRGAFAGRTDSEDELILTLQPLGGVDAQGLQALQDLARISGFKDTFAGTPPVPGPLEFILGWIPGPNSAGGASNLDLLVTDPNGQTASPTNTVIGSGSAIGTHMGDDVGASGSGSENVVWGLFFPPGNYTVTARHQGGDESQVFIDVLKGQASDEVATFGRETPIVLQSGQNFSQTVNVTGGDTTTTTTTSSQRNRAAARQQQREAKAHARQLTPAAKVGGRK